MESIAFIGIGIMGRPMIENLMKRGYPVHIWARHREKAQGLIDAGAVYHDTLSDAVRAATVVMTIVGGPADVEQLYLGEDGILSAARPGSYLIDFTTSSPELAKRLYAKGKELGLHVLDIPVTGGDVGAREGTLSLLAGGDAADLDAVREILTAVSSQITLEGPAGSGQHVKCVNQIMVGGALAGMAEGFAYARRQGLDLGTVLRSIEHGAAGSKTLDLYARRVVEGDYLPGGFTKFFVKDLRIAIEEARKSGLDLNISEEILQSYMRMVDRGMGDLGTHALVKLYDKEQQ